MRLYGNAFSCRIERTNIDAPIHPAPPGASVGLAGKNQQSTPTHDTQMKTNGKFLAASIMVLALGAATSAQAAVIGLSDYSLAPDGQNLTTTFQNTNVNTLNGGTVLPASGTPVVYFVTTFTFGEASDAHLQAQFYVNETSAPRLGVEVQDTGLVQFIATNDTTRTSFNFAQDMAGQTVTLLAKLSYDANNNVTYGKTNTADDTIMNVWVNPTISAVEGSGLAAGDMSTIWNSAGFNWFRQTIQNQSTPSTAGASSIINTTILTGSDATFANALAIATIPEPAAALLGGIGLLALLRRRRNG
jgi:hypothetical protein